MNKNLYKRWLQSDVFTNKLLQIMRDEHPDRQPQIIQQFLIENVPPNTFTPKKRNGWNPNILKTLQVIDI